MLIFKVCHLYCQQMLKALLRAVWRETKLSFSEMRCQAVSVLGSLSRQTRGPINKIHIFQKAAVMDFSFMLFYLFIHSLMYSHFTLLLPSHLISLLYSSGVHGQREVPVRKRLWCVPQEARWERQRLHRLRKDHLPIWRPEKKLQRSPWQVWKREISFVFLCFFILLLSPFTGELIESYCLTDG